MRGVRPAALSLWLVNWSNARPYAHYCFVCFVGRGRPATASTTFTGHTDGAHGRRRAISAALFTANVNRCRHTSARRASIWLCRWQPAQPKSRSCLGRALISLAIAALLLIVMMACGWAAVVRPAIHRSLDQSLRSGLAAQVDKVGAIPVGSAPIVRTITDTELNRQARAGIRKTIRAT